MKKTCSWVMFIFGVAFCLGLNAQKVPLENQIKLMLKIISMDRKIARYGNPIKIGTSSNDFLKELNKFKETLRIKGIEFSGEMMSSPEDISKFKVVYIGENWTTKNSAISAKAIENQCLVFCQDEELVHNSGGAISFIIIDGKPKIVLNLENVKKQGSDFPAGFLKITMVLGSLDQQ